ncbi:unnamed protein product [Cochlearia groenlandica]
MSFSNIIFIDGCAQRRRRARHRLIMTWTRHDHVAKYRWISGLFAIRVGFFLCVEDTRRMFLVRSEPFDVEFVATRYLDRVLVNSSDLNT